MSISGGLYKAIQRIQKVGGTALQIFSKNQRQWRVPSLTEESIQAFKEEWQKWGRYPVAVHTSYLINLAAKNKDILKRSVSAFADELKRAALLGIPFVIIHPGSHGGEGVKTGLKKVVQSLDRSLELSETTEVMILLETTAGQGTNLGASFEELAFILEKSKYQEKLGVCVDTAHIFAAGYDLRTPTAYARTFDLLEKNIGLSRVRFFHLNDSRTALGSRKDRHEHIGQGQIGLAGFKLLLNDPRFQDHPMVLETPKGKDLLEDIENLKVLNSLLVF
jgi:deoxyribonuclease-4